jgi:hypothetical protein
MRKMMKKAGQMKKFMAQARRAGIPGLG